MCGSIAPHAGGPTPHARCAVAEPPAAFEAGVGALRLHLAARELRIDGAPDVLRVALVRGPSPSSAPLQPSVEALGRARPDLVLCVGGFGDDPPSILGTLRALAALPMPVLLVAGGRDDLAMLRAGLAQLPPEARTRVLDLSSLRRVRVGAVVLVPAAGAPDGRYARSDEACGLGAADVEAIVDDVGVAEGETRFLVSWAAPDDPASSRGIEGAPSGSALVGDLAERIGARGVLSAWPEAQVGRTFLDTVPALAVASALVPGGPPRADGSEVVPGVTLLELGAGGLSSAAP
jgi:hypothetical protein